MPGARPAQTPRPRAHNAPIPSTIKRINSAPSANCQRLSGSAGAGAGGVTARKRGAIQIGGLVRLAGIGGPRVDLVQVLIFRGSGGGAGDLRMGVGLAARDRRRGGRRGSGGGAVVGATSGAGGGSAGPVSPVRARAAAAAVVLVASANAPVVGFPTSRAWGGAPAADDVGASTAPDRCRPGRVEHIAAEDQHQQDGDQRRGRPQPPGQAPAEAAPAFHRPGHHMADHVGGQDERARDRVQRHFGQQLLGRLERRQLVLARRAAPQVRRAPAPVRRRSVRSPDRPTTGRARARPRRPGPHLFASAN